MEAVTFGEAAAVEAAAALVMMEILKIPFMVLAAAAEVVPVMLLVVVVQVVVRTLHLQIITEDQQDQQELPLREVPVVLVLLLMVVEMVVEEALPVQMVHQEWLELYMVAGLAVLLARPSTSMAILLHGSAATTQLTLRERFRDENSNRIYRRRRQHLSATQAAS
jgi:TRAP-type uncharacterized transport system fused permease subunit